MSKFLVCVCNFAQVSEILFMLNGGFQSFTKLLQLNDRMSFPPPPATFITDKTSIPSTFLVILKHYRRHFLLKILCSQKYLIVCAYRLLQLSGFSDDLILKDLILVTLSGQEAPTNDGDYKGEVINMLAQHWSASSSFLSRCLSQLIV